MTVLGPAALLVLLAGWIGYPVFLLMRRTGRVRPLPPPAGPLPPVTVVIATREDPVTIRSRLADLSAATYAGPQVPVVVAVDIASGRTPEDYEFLRTEFSGTTFVGGDEPGGKAATLNAGVRAAGSAWVAMADSAQEWEPGALRAMVACAIAEGAGGASGVITTVAERGAMRVFWRYETWLRRLESGRRGLVAVTGAIYCLRRDLWTPLPPGLICDDLLVPIRAATKGSGIVSCESARSRDPRLLSRLDQFRRKVRTLTGMLQVCVWEPWVLHPGRNLLWAEFVGHKLIRIATPYLVLLAGWWLFTVLGPGLALGGLAAGFIALVLLARRSPFRILTEAFWAVVMLAAPVQATWNAVRGHWDVWQGASAALPHGKDG